jgi:hypothetical protein
MPFHLRPTERGYRGNKTTTEAEIGATEAVETAEAEVGETVEAVEIGAVEVGEAVTTGVRPVRGVVGYRGGDPSTAGSRGCSPETAARPRRHNCLGRPTPLTTLRWMDLQN